MAIFVPNSPLAGFNVSTGSLQGPAVVLDSLTGASTPTFLIAGGAVGDEFFISASNFNVKANGNITASNALLSGTITATAGFIGGWVIGSTTLSSNGVVLDSANGQIRTTTDFAIGDGFFLGSGASNNFRVGLAGGSRLQFTGNNIEIYSSNNRVVSLGTVNEIAGFGLTPAAISSSNNQLVLRSNGQITGSNVLLDGGRIGGFTLSGNAFTGTNFFISGSATGDSFFISASNFNVKANGNVTASSALFSGSVSITGTVTATAGAIGGFVITQNALTGSGFFISGSPGNSGTGFFISSSRFNVKGNGDITGSNVLFTGGTIASFALSNNALTAGSTFFISSSVSGTPSTAFFISSSRFNVKQDGTITGSNVLFNGGTVGGFTIDSSKITGTNIIIDSAGSIQTSNYASDLSGWKIDAAGNGTAEFENVKIRGTLSTAVFEKQSVNAVGGQLYVANSTILTGSGETGASTNGQYTATQATMSVENVTGFENGEIITAKKFSGTGFGTEYMRINSASRANPSSDTDFSGRIYVTRGYGSGTTGNSGSLGETPGAGQTYSGSQVIVSTGKLGTGFIRINASPNAQATPYIDIVERTGSGIYDVALKARIGDLSGLANSSYVLGNSNPGFGIATDNGYFQGRIEVGSLPQAPPAERLLAYYPLDSLNFIDASGNCPGTGSYSIAPTIISGSGTIAGFAVKDNGGSGIRPVTSSAIKDALTSAQFTMCFWYTPKPQLGDYRDLVAFAVTSSTSFGNVSSDANFRIEHSNDFTAGRIHPTLQFVWNAQGSSGTIYPSVNSNAGYFTTGSNYHIAFVSDFAASSLKLYVNGSIIKSASFTTSGVPVTGFSAAPDLKLRFFRETTNGEVLSEFRIYTGSLTDAQIESIYLGNAQLGGGKTVIDGNSIKTGKLQSSNWTTGGSVGSEFDLNNGTFKLGGDAAPKLSWNGTTLLVSGTLNAVDGNIGGFAITKDAITGSGFFLSGSATNNGTSFFLSSSRFNIKGNGDVTGSQVLFTGGKIGGFDITTTQISDTLGDLVLKSNGQITASNMLLDGGVIRSANYSTTAGSEINLADGTFDFGGSSTYYPGIRFDGTTLNVKGDVTADTGNFLNVNVRGSVTTTFFTGSDEFLSTGAIQKTALESWTTSSGTPPTTGWKPITTGSLMSGSVSGISFRLPWKAPRLLWNVDLATPTETLTNIVRSCSYDQGPSIGTLIDKEWDYSADSTLYGLPIGTTPYQAGLSFRPQTSGSVGANQWNFTTGSWQGIRLENVALTSQTVASVSRPLQITDRVLIAGFTPDTNRSITARVIVKASSTYATGGQTTSPFYVTTYEGAESEAFVLKIPLSGIVGYVQNRGAQYFEIDNGKVDIEVQWKFTGYLGTAPTGVSSVRLHEIKILDVPRIENLAVRNFSIGNGLKSAIVFEPVYPILDTTANPSGEVRLRNPSHKENNTNGFHDLTVRNSTLMGETDTVLSVGATASLFGTPTALIYNSKTGTEADAQLEIGGSGYSGVHYLDSSAYTIGQNSGVRAVRIYSNTTATGVVLGPGSSSWSSYSDERLKENISPILNSIDKIKNVRCVYYDLKDVDSNGTANRIGVIAQDLTGSLPQVVDTVVHPNNGTSYLSVKYTELIPVLLKAIQEQQETIANLQLRITTLESGSL